MNNYLSKNNSFNNFNHALQVSDSIVWLHGCVEVLCAVIVAATSQGLQFKHRRYHFMTSLTLMLHNAYF